MKNHNWVRGGFFFIVFIIEFALRICDNLSLINMTIIIFRNLIKAWYGNVYQIVMNVSEKWNIYYLVIYAYVRPCSVLTTTRSNIFCGKGYLVNSRLFGGKLSALYVHWTIWSVNETSIVRNSSSISKTKYINDISRINGIW